MKNCIPCILSCRDRDVVSNNEWFDDTIIAFWIRWMKRFELYDINKLRHPYLVSIMFPELVYKNFEYVLGNLESIDDEKNDNVMEYRMCDIFNDDSHCSNCAIVLIPINVNNLHRFLIILFNATIYEEWIINDLDIDECAPHLFIIDPMYENIQPIHTKAIKKINEWIQNDSVVASNTSNARVINHSMVNLAHNFVFEPRDYGSMVCYYMWVIYKLIVTYKIDAGGSVDAFHLHIKQIIDKITIDEVSNFRVQLSSVMDKILEYYSNNDSTLLYYPLKKNRNKRQLEDDMSDDSINSNEDNINDIPMDKFDYHSITQEKISTEEHNKNLAKIIVNRSYDNMIKTYEKKLTTLNGTLRKVEEKLKKDNIKPRELLCLQSRREKTRKSISNINTMITSTTNCKLISKNIISGHDRVYAFKLNENSNIISALVKHPTISKLQEKQIDVEVLQQEYLDKVNEIVTKYRDTINPKDWIFCKKVSNSTILANTKQAITVKQHYMKNNTIPFLRTKNVSYISKVRVTLTVVGDYNYKFNQHCDIKDADFKFHVLNQDNNKYHYITEEEFCDMCHKDKIMKWKVTSIVYFLNNWDIEKTNVKLYYPDDDLEDPDFEAQQLNRGHYGLPVFVYFPIKDHTIFDYDFQQTQLQISAVGYHKRLNKFYGLVLHPDGRKSHEEVDEKWIKDNDWEQWYQTDNIIDFIKNNTDQSNMSFIRYGWGLPVKSNTETDNETDKLKEYYIYNQPIEYQQNGKPTCAFSSLASMLFLQGYTKESIFIENCGNYDSKLIPGESELVLNRIATLFHQNKVFQKMRKKQFMTQRLTTTLLDDFDILKWEFLDNEFLLGVLWGEDGFHFHVCCFSKDMIVDANQQYALHLNQETLNIICKCDFKRLYNALYFHQRKSRPIPGKAHCRKRKKTT